MYLHTYVFIHTYVYTYVLRYSSQATLHSLVSKVHVKESQVRAISHIIEHSNFPLKAGNL